MRLTVDNLVRRLYVGGPFDGERRLSNNAAILHFPGHNYHLEDFHGQPVYRYEGMSVQAVFKELAAKAVHDLTFKEFSTANTKRSNVLWPQCQLWTPQDWIVASLGELGEAANVEKKIKRDGGTPELVQHFHYEVYDTMAYADLTITFGGGVTETVARKKWNLVSERNNYPVRL